jgi:hypothetical protein
MRRQLGWLCILPALASLTPTQSAAAGTTFTSAMQAAAQARQVPLPLIEATAYVNSRWEWIATPARDGGVGPMHIMPSQMAQAAVLSGHSRAEIAGDLSANLDAGGALLANAHTGGDDLTAWQPAVSATQGSFVAAQIFDALRSGQTATASTGEQITLAPQALASPSPTPPRAAAPAQAAAVPDYSGATWIPADSANYTVADRPHDYPVDMIVIHDIEGTYGSAIQAFQDPSREASAHYVISDAGQIAQMVAEKDIAWHAGNWDYNTRAIGIEHEGYAYAQPTWYTPVMYQASAQVAASICSRWGVPMDRTHVIGHSEVPDPNNPGLFGGTDHHTDPGPYWDWTYYMGLAQSYAGALPSPPRMMPDPVAASSGSSATVTWQAARSCHSPITGYTVTGQPGNLVRTLPPTARTATFNGLQAGVDYTFNVTATNADGQNTLTAQWRCSAVNVNAAPASPQGSGTTVAFTASASGCPHPLYQFWILAPGSTTWQIKQAYSSSATFSWNTTGLPAGDYMYTVWVSDASSTGASCGSLGCEDAYFPGTNYRLFTTPCTSVSASAAPASPQASGTAVAFTASASGCARPLYQFWILPPGSSIWQVKQAYSSMAIFNWNTTGLPAGNYLYTVWVRDASSTGTSCGSLGCEDAYFPGTSYTLGPIPCRSVTTSAAPASPQLAGTAVTFTASAAGCPRPLYQFWILPPGSSTWQVKQAYSSMATFNWNTTGLPAGNYLYTVWVRDASSTGTSCGSLGCQDTYFPGTAYRLTTTPCTSVTASAAPASPQASGTSVTFTASASGCPNPLYQFWILPPGSSTWQIKQAYSSTATFTWTTAGLPAGNYMYTVWVRDASSPGTSCGSLGCEDAYFPGTTYTLR